jgi:aryl-alcohol dehydrogenase-like predicted oxidoreductase
VAPGHDSLITRKAFLKTQLGGLVSLGLATGLGSVARGMINTSDQNKALRVLGRTGLRVTPFGMGASRTMEVALIRMALDMGINFIDTGRSYFNGQNEVAVGQAIKGLRDRVILQSKVKLRLGKRLDDRKITALMQSSLESSLKALQTDYIDVWLLHMASTVELIQNDAVMKFFSDAREQGQIRACGFSSHSNQVTLLKAANKSNFYDVIMVPYNHLGSYKHSSGGGGGSWNQEELETELILAANAGTGVVGMKTCSGGPYAFKGEPEATYTSALRWVLQKPFVHTTAVAMANTDQLHDNLEVLA